LPRLPADSRGIFASSGSRVYFFVSGKFSPSEKPASLQRIFAPDFQRSRAQSKNKTAPTPDNSAAASNPNPPEPAHPLQLKITTPTTP